ncbi:hypothetical protein [Butyrivibrio sp. XPD2002]|uniref:hypothetical protein n=1 Tax=Butyrivibrio sp. XPD2002 TaxID=1280665 RepID=UPI00040DA8F3|nr:hypothetical protein [Butyrivibrio sp. XPD2002]
MKNQYVGDIGDYGKYALLRAFAEVGIKVGINWYLTEDDASNDGKFTNYLQDETFRRYAPEVFDTLEKIADNQDKTVTDIEDSGIVPGALFYSDVLNPVGTPSDREQERMAWFQESINELKDAELIYMDPDNGLQEDNEPGKRGSEKYVLPDEVEQYYRAGHNVVYYCHKGRRKLWDWHNHKSVMCKVLPDAKYLVLTYHKGTQRSYIFLIHPEDFQKYNEIIRHFQDGWRKIFSFEYTEKGDPASEQVGDKFTIENTDGSVITLYKRADGWIQIENSKVKNLTKAMRPDLVCDFLWGR